MWNTHISERLSENTGSTQRVARAAQRRENIGVLTEKSGAVEMRLRNAARQPCDSNLNAGNNGGLRANRSGKNAAKGLRAGVVGYRCSSTRENEVCSELAVGVPAKDLRSNVDEKLRARCEHKQQCGATASNDDGMRRLRFVRVGVKVDVEKSQSCNHILEQAECLFSESIDREARNGKGTDGVSEGAGYVGWRPTNSKENTGIARSTVIVISIARARAVDMDGGESGVQPRNANVTENDAAGGLSEGQSERCAACCDDASAGVYRSRCVRPAPLRVLLPEIKRYCCGNN